MTITAKEAAALIGQSSSKQITALCRKGALYASKNREWEIPVESFVIFLKRNPDMRLAFLSQEEGDDKRMNAINRKVRALLNRQVSDYEGFYTYAQLSMIFGVPVNTIAVMFKDVHRPPFWYKLAPGKTEITVEEVYQFLDTHPEKHADLIERHKMLLATPTIDPGESALRHLLMLYAYYKQEE